MSSHRGIIPAEIFWYQTTFFSRLITLLCPPLGLAILWTNPNRGFWRRLLGTLVIAFYSVPYTIGFGMLMVSLGFADIEWKGGFGPSLVRHKTEPNYRAVDASRALQEEAVAGTNDTPVPTSMWTDFRGPKRDGVYTEQPILTNWPAEGPKRLWHQPIGGGYASFVTGEGLAFTIEQRREEETISAYRIATGREVWVYSYPSLFTEWMGGDGPRATPTYHDGFVYGLGASGDLCCLTATNGALVWRTNILTANQSRNLRYGMAASPLINGDQIIVLTGDTAENRGVVAYHPKTGAKLWSALSECQSYTSPMNVTLGGVPQLLIVTSSRVLGLSPDGRKTLWDMPWKVSYDNAIATPVVVDADRFVISAGYGTGAALIEISADIVGMRAREVWRNRNLKTKFNPAVFWDGHLYGLDEGVLACVEVTTGERRWRDGRYGYGQLLLASGHLIVLGGNGILALVPATPTGFQEIGRVQALPGKTWNVPALTGGLLLVRNASEMACFDLRAP